MVSEMKQLLKKPDYGPSYWQEYIALQSEHHRRWWYDQLGEVTTRICRRVGLMGMQFRAVFV